MINTRLLPSYFLITSGLLLDYSHFTHWLLPDYSLISQEQLPPDYSETTSRLLLYYSLVTFRLPLGYSQNAPWWLPDYFQTTTRVLPEYSLITPWLPPVYFLFPFRLLLSKFRRWVHSNAVQALAGDTISVLKTPTQRQSISNLRLLSDNYHFVFWQYNVISNQFSSICLSF